MLLTFLVSCLFGCTFFANGFFNENKRFRLLRSGCSRPRWWFSATLFLTLVGFTRVGFTCYGQLPQQRRAPGGGLPRNGPTGEREVHPTFEGDVKTISKKEVFISSETGNGLKFHITGKTTAYDGDNKIKVSSLQVGQHVAVEAQLDLDGSYDAVNIRLKAATPPNP
jgi:hypothetical protein